MISGHSAVRSAGFIEHLAEAAAAETAEDNAEYSETD